MGRGSSKLLQEISGELDRRAEARLDAAQVRRAVSISGWSAISHTPSWSTVSSEIHTNYLAIVLMFRLMSAQAA
jgi:hypothetical protein